MGGERPVDLTSVDSGALAELRLRYRLQRKQKEKLGNKQLEIDKTLSFLKAANLLYRFDWIVLRLCMY